MSWMLLQVQNRLRSSTLRRSLVGPAVLTIPGSTRRRAATFPSLILDY